MKEDYITFDFANGKIEVRNSGEQGTIAMPDLADKPPLMPRRDWNR